MFLKIRADKEGLSPDELWEEAAAAEAVRAYEAFADDVCGRWRATA